MSGFDIIGPGAYGPPQRPIAAPRPDVDPRIGGDLGEGIGGLDEGHADDTFSTRLSEALERVSSLEDESKAKAEALARGEDVELHDLMISMGKSEVAFNMMLEVRNKLLDAWETITRSAV